MACKIIPYCKFIDDIMGPLPKAAEYIKQKQCLGDYESCIYFRIYKNSHDKMILLNIKPCDKEELSKIMDPLINI
jgi:hypothetical protein